MTIVRTSAFFSYSERFFSTCLTKMNERHCREILDEVYINCVDLLLNDEVVSE